MVRVFSFVFMPSTFLLPRYLTSLSSVLQLNTLSSLNISSLIFVRFCLLNIGGFLRFIVSFRRPSSSMNLYAETTEAFRNVSRFYIIHVCTKYSLKCARSPAVREKNTRWPLLLQSDILCPFPCSSDRYISCRCQTASPLGCPLLLWL